jgi:hypothetical protein
LYRSGTEDPEEVAQGSQVEIADGTELWFTKEAFRYKLTLSADDEEIRPMASTGVKVSVADPNSKEFKDF